MRFCVLKALNYIFCWKHIFNQVAITLFMTGLLDQALLENANVNRPCREAWGS